MASGENTLNPDDVIVTTDADGNLVATTAADVASAGEDPVATGTVQTRFCGTEERVSTHTCNSLHPSVAIDPYGNVGTAWHDTRDGTFEIYFRTLPSKISQEEALEALAARMGEDGRTIRLDCDPVEDLGLSGQDLIFFEAARRCGGETENSGVLLRGENGSLAVNVNARSMVMSTPDEGIDFFAAGLQAGSLLRIETGLNANLQVVVSAVLGTSSLQLAFVDSAVSDSGFSFSILENPSFSLTTCETRLTCSEFTSQFPSVVADSDGRWHVVYQSNNSGENQLYYIQIAPKDIGIKDECATEAPINSTGGFSEVLAGTPGSVTFIDRSNPAAPVSHSFRVVGDNGAFFSFGNRFLVPAVPNNSPFQIDRNATHTLFKDFISSGANGKWTGISPADERAAWDAQIDALGSSASPDVVFGSGHPIGAEGDFGTRFDSESVSFMVQTPPASGVVLGRVALPLRPKCAPRSAVGTVELREQDLVAAPKRPLPPSFADPIDLSQILQGPVTTDSSTPSRFMIEGDAGGTIFTNLLTDNARGELTRLVFKKDTDGDEIKFVLGAQVCGDCPCGVKVPSNVLQPETSVQYKIKLEVWQGSDYRLDSSQVSSAQMGAAKLYEKEFKFDQGEDLSTFVFEPGELILPAGSIIFFVPIASDNVSFVIDGVGGGNTVWLTSSDGIFTNYNTVPFVLRPFTGLNAPVYYDGTLVRGLEVPVQAEPVLASSISTKNAQVAASVAFGQKGNEPTDPTAYAVSQGFTLSTGRELKSILLRSCRGTSAGDDGSGNSIPEDIARTLVVEIMDDNNGVPGTEVQASATINAADIRPFYDFENIPTDADMADLIISFQDVSLPAGGYHILMREDGDTDSGGRFWILTDINMMFPVGPAAWNSSRPVSASTWRTLSGQIQLVINLGEEVE